MLFFQELLILCCEILNLILLSNIIDHLWLIQVLINKYYIDHKEKRNRFISGYKKAPVVIMTTETL